MKVLPKIEIVQGFGKVFKNYSYVCIFCAYIVLFSRRVLSPLQDLRGDYVNPALGLGRMGFLNYLDE